MNQRLKEIDNLFSKTHVKFLDRFFVKHLLMFVTRSAMSARQKTAVPRGANSGQTLTPAPALTRGSRHQKEERSYRLTRRTS